MKRTVPDMHNYKGVKLAASLDDKINDIKHILNNSSDLLINPMEIAGVRTALIAFEGMISTSTTSRMIMVPLMEVKLPEDTTSMQLFEHIRDKMMLTLDRVISEDYGDIITRVMSGFAILLIDGVDRAFSLGVQGYETRGVDEPSSEGNITGAHEGFVETVRTNMSLVRRRIKSPLLQFKLFSISSRSNVDVILCYMADRVSMKLVKGLEKRLKDIPLETILGCGYAEPYLNNTKLSVFSGVSVTERPDVMCARLIEGRIGLLIEGTPFALVMPALFSDNFHTIDDYNFRPYYATFIRLIRYAAFIIAVFLPGIYTAAVIHHRELIRRELLLNLAAAESSAPLPIMAEALIVLLFYQVIREAGVRLPKSVGGAVSIIGGLVIGDTAVSAGIITDPMLMVCAISVTASFVIPSLDQPVTVLRLMSVIAGGLMGLYGVALIAAAALVNICSLENYGVPVTSPMSPLTGKALGDVFVRLGFKRLDGRNVTVEEYNGVDKN